MVMVKENGIFLTGLLSLDEPLLRPTLSPVQQRKLSAQANSLICYSIISKSPRGSQVPSSLIQSLGGRRFENRSEGYSI